MSNRSQIIVLILVSIPALPILYFGLGLLPLYFYDPAEECGFAYDTNQQREEHVERIVASLQEDGYASWMSHDSKGKAYVRGSAWTLDDVKLMHNHVFGTASERDHASQALPAS